MPSGFSEVVPAISSPVWPSSVATTVEETDGEGVVEGGGVEDGGGVGVEIEGVVPQDSFVYGELPAPLKAFTR
jgi:hypothetical protein